MRGRARIETLCHRWLEDRGYADELVVNGHRLEVTLDDLIGRSIYVNGIWERQNTDARLARPGDSIFDVGANIEYYSLLFSRLVRADGRVFAFEPVPSTLAALRSNLARNKGTSNVAVVESALSNQRSWLQINVSGSRNTGASHIAAAPVDDAGRTRAGVTCTILEAMACGVPIVTTDVGHVPEVVDDTRNGFVVREATPRGFIDAMTVVREGGERVAGITTAARRFVEDQRDHRTGLRRVNINAIYDSAIVAFNARSVVSGPLRALSRTVLGVRHAARRLERAIRRA